MVTDSRIVYKHVDGTHSFKGFFGEFTCLIGSDKSAGKEIVDASLGSMSINALSLSADRSDNTRRASCLVSSWVRADPKPPLAPVHKARFPLKVDSAIYLVSAI